MERKLIKQNVQFHCLFVLHFQMRITADCSEAEVDEEGCEPPNPTARQAPLLSAPSPLLRFCLIIRFEVLTQTKFSECQYTYWKNPVEKNRRKKLFKGAILQAVRQ